VGISSIGSDKAIEPAHTEGYQSARCFAIWLDSVDDKDLTWFVPANSRCGEPLTNIRTFIFYDGVVCDTVRTGEAADPNKGSNSNLEGVKGHRSK
jgi:hypothetical protein